MFSKVSTASIGRTFCVYYYLLNLAIFRFHWDLNRFLPDFSITPVEGYITPGMEVTFDVNFHPQIVSQDIRYDVSFYLFTYFLLNNAVMKTALLRDCLSFQTTFLKKVSPC